MKALDIVQRCHDHDSNQLRFSYSAMSADLEILNESLTECRQASKPYQLPTYQLRPRVTPSSARFQGCRNCTIHAWLKSSTVGLGSSSRVCVTLLHNNPRSSASDSERRLRCRRWDSSTVALNQQMATPQLQLAMSVTTVAVL